VRAGDFRIEEQDGAPADAVADPALLEGRRLVRVLPSGALARQEAFERPLLVKRGDRLLLTVGDGGVVVEAPLEALASGREDDLIECRNPLTGTLLKARITGPGTAVPEANK
jgi:flagella basal body P-ring formation protein FlgA